MHISAHVWVSCRHLNVACFCACACDCVDQTEDSMNRHSTNSIYRPVMFVCVRVCACVCVHVCACVHTYACRCVKEREIAASTQCSAKDNKKFLLDRGGSHESGVIPAPSVSSTPKQTHPEVELHSNSASLCVEVITEVLKLSLFLCF